LYKTQGINFKSFPDRPADFDYAQSDSHTEAPPIFYNVHKEGMTVTGVGLFKSDKIALT